MTDGHYTGNNFLFFRLETSALLFIMWDFPANLLKYVDILT
jgi:hypothetical protein